MALPRASGRSRTIVTACSGEARLRNGNLTYITGSQVVTSDAGNATCGWFAANASSAVVEITSVSVTGTGIVPSGGSVGFTVTVRLRSTSGAFATVVATRTGIVLNNRANSVQYNVANAVFHRYDVAMRAAGEADLEEWIQTDFSRFEKYTGYRASLTGLATGIQVQIVAAGFEVVTGTPFAEDTSLITFPDLSSTGSSSGSIAAPDQLNFSYGWTHTLRSEGNVPVQSVVSGGGPGIGTMGVELLAQAGLSGTSVQPSFTHPGSGGTAATATVQGEPDWAYRGEIEFRSYDGSRIEGRTKHLCGNGSTVMEQVGNASNGLHRYPVNGYSGWASYTIQQPAVSNITWENYRKILRCGTVPTNLNSANYLQVDEEWADEQGILFQNNAGNGKWCAVWRTERFDAGTISVAPSHAFDLFEDLGNWSADSRLTFGDVLTYTNPDSTVRQITATYVLRPWGYRYYRFSVRGKAGARFALILTRSTSRASLPEEVPIYGPTRTFTAKYTWNFTISRGDVWETKRFDFLFPDEFEDGASFDERYPVHPELFYSAGVTGLKVEFQDAGTYELDAFTGYHRTGAGRIPVLLTLYPSLAGSQPQGETLETYENPTINPSLIYLDENWVAGRLVVNGARGAWFGRNTGVSSQTVKTIWDEIKAALDTATRDTGISVTVDTGDFPTEVQYRSSQRPDEALFERIDHETFTAQHQLRSQTSFGYYGMGDIHTGEYGAELVYRGTKWLNGIVQGVLFYGPRPIRSASLQLRDPDDASTLGRGSSNCDGYYQIVGKYGVVEPYSNLPISSDWNDRKQYSGSSQPYAYTETGKRFNHHWLRSRQFVDRDEEYYGTDDDGRVPVVVIDRYTSWYDWLAFPGPGPANLATDWGWYLRASSEEGRVRVRRARWFVPPFDSTAWASEGLPDAYPELVREARGRTWVVWERLGDGVYRVYSDDDGETWSEAEMLFGDGAQYGRPAVDPQTGDLFFAAYRDGSIVLRHQASGDAEPGPESTVEGFPADLPDDSFGLTVDYSPQRRLIFVVNVGEESEEDETQEYVSTDNGATVTLVETG